MSSKRPPAPPPALAGFTYVDVLGSGGFADVYLYEQHLPRRRVAVKVMLADRMAGDAVEQFTAEANVMAMLSTHPAIVTIYQAGVSDDGRPYLVMEYCPKPNLQIRSRASAFSIAEALRVGVQVGAAVETAHRAGILHRDIKPANIFITKKKRVKLGDFGIAHLTNVEQNDFTQISAQIGTLPYMSPEQVQEGRLCPASDIYAVGVVFYEMLTGQPPFINGDIAYHHVYTPPAPPGVSPMIDALILRCLEKDPANRPQSAEEFANTLRAQMKQAAERLNKYREMLKMAVIDREISHAERMVLKMKRAALNLTDEEARRVEQEFGLNLQ